MSFPRTNLDQDPREPSMTLSMGPQRVEASNNPALNSPWSSIDSDASAGAGQWVMEQREVPVKQLTLPASHYRQLENRMHNIMPADCSQHHQKRQRHTVCKLFAEQARSRRSVNCFLTVYNVRSTSHKLKRGQLYCQEISTNSVPSCFRNPYSVKFVSVWSPK